MVLKPGIYVLGVLIWVFFWFGFFFSLSHYKIFLKYFGYEKLFCFYVRQIMLWICQMAVDSWVHLFFRLHKTIFNYEVNVFAVT